MDGRNLHVQASQIYLVNHLPNPAHQSKQSPCDKTNQEKCRSDGMANPANETTWNNIARWNGAHAVLKGGNHGSGIRTDKQNHGRQDTDFDFNSLSKDWIPVSFSAIFILINNDIK